MQPLADEDVAERVLISLHIGYGLGDSTQMSAVLQHVVKAHPHWIIDYRAEEGQHQVGRGIVANTLTYEEPLPSAHYDAEMQIILYDTWYGWHDRPNTRVSSCLHERFGLPWVPECGRYKINVSEEAKRMVGLLLHGERCVAVHYEGESAQDKKNLSHVQADAVCTEIERLGYTPLVLDWRCRSPLHHRKMRAPAAWGCDAEMVCAVIARCKAFVGIDSGPAKCASATNTPTLVVWTGHHPAPFHDPADNTTHLVPTGYHDLQPVCNDPGVVRFFEENYNVVQYRNDPVVGVKAWLSEVLR